MAHPKIALLNTTSRISSLLNPRSDSNWASSDDISIGNWESFVESKEKIYNKDLSEKTHPNKKILTKIIDLHGFSLENANKTINEFINRCFSENVKRVTVITGKGLRSNTQNDPYASKDLSILKI